MSSPTLQFVVAGALVVAWAWMLGRPLLTSLFRRSRRDSVGHFRYQQAVLSQQPGVGHRASRSWGDRPRPLLNWRSQPLERRRLQVMLGFGMATFVSLLMAIALRGFFVRLFLVMAMCFVGYLCVAAYIGSVQLRRQQEVYAARHRTPVDQVGLRQETVQDQHTGYGESTGQSDDVERAEREVAPQPVQPWQGSVLFPEPDTTLEDHDASGAVFDDDFFEPIPELSFEPLNLDASLFDPSKPEQGSLFGDSGGRDHSGEFFEQLVGRDQTGEFFEIDNDGWIEEPLFEERDVVGDDYLDADLDRDHNYHRGHDHEHARVDAPAASAETVAPSEDEAIEPTRYEATFTAAPAQRQRPPKRNKARPIYIESQLDEGDDQIKAVND